MLFGAVVASWLAASTLACGDAPRPGDRSSGGAAVGGLDLSAEDAAGAAPHTGDLPEIRADGRLRILVLRRPEQDLPRSGSPRDAERRLAADLARDLELEAVFVPVDGLDALVPALLDGRGDLIAENFTVTEDRRRRVAFSTPIATVSEQVVVRASDTGVSGPSDLVGRRIAVRPSSSLWESARALQAEHPGITLEEAPERMDTGDLLDAVAVGEFDVTLADSNLVRDALAWRDDLRVGFDLGRSRLIAWAVRPDSPELRKAVDAHLARALSGAPDSDRATDDWDGIRRRGVLRVLTRNSATTYFIWRGQLMGFEYELARRFATRSGLRIEMIVPPSREDLIPWLKAGKGDVVAANLTASDRRAREEGVAFSRNYLGAVEQLVCRRDDPIAGPEDLRGREIAVRRSSSYWQTLEGLRDRLGFELVAAPEQLETEALIDRVASGVLDLTVADSHVLGVELTWRDDVRAAFALGDPVDHGWAVRPENPALLAAIDAFLAREFRGLFYNVLVRKYFEDPHKVRRHAEERARGGRISRFDPLIRRYAEMYAFDWRLIAAQAYQESRFDPSAHSFAGARGLLQVLPRTAREFGFEDLDDPETGIHAGVRYLDWIRDRFPEPRTGSERIWLSLAAYNVGTGHVRDAQRLARERGWNPNLWFGHVEKAMLLKEDPEIHSRTRFGYARGSEPVAYVREIRDRYNAYVRVAAPLAAADPSPRPGGGPSPSGPARRPGGSALGPARPRDAEPQATPDAASTATSPAARSPRFTAASSARRHATPVSASSPAP